jgi:uncharacterized membrane protein
MQTTLWLVFLLVALIAAVAVYSRVLYTKAKSELWQWWTTLVGTFVSVLAAFIIALIIQGIIAANESEARSDYANAIVRANLDQIKAKVVDEGSALSVALSTGAVYEFPASYCSALGLEEALRTGNLRTDIVVDIWKLAEDIDSYNLLVETGLGLISHGDSSSPDFPLRLSRFSENLRTSAGHILEQTDALLERLPLDGEGKSPMRQTPAVIGLIMVAIGTLLVGFVGPLARGPHGCLDDRNFPALRGLLKLPRSREDWEAFAWYIGWALICGGSLLQLTGTLRC